MPISMVDFFSGCGGTSSGFKSSGIKILSGIDNDLDSAKSFKANFPEATFYRQDITKMACDELILNIDRNKDKLLFSGCAPCQPFSKQNKKSTSNDSRTALIFEFFRFIKHWLPDYVFIENVPGMQKVETGSLFTKFTQQLAELGYKVKYKVIFSVDYGVPQKRQRLVMLASLAHEIDIPASTHGKGLKDYTTVRDCIGDLPPLKAGQVHSSDSQHVSSSLSPLNMERIKNTREGGSRETWPDRLKLECHKTHKGHSDVYGRLSWDKPASALTTRCISYSNGRFGHPEQDRALSIREAALLQTFPRDFIFYGSLASKARQIGNAVPPKLSEAFGKALLHHN